jgi:ElaB/YqjD/DUF883 family membrane-anchored ribosome-binding protein
MRESAQLQREAEVQRAGLSNTLGQLRDGMTSQALSAELVGVLRDSSLTLVKSLADSARGNPGAALLIGAGLTMMLTKTTGADVMSTATSAIRAASSASADAAVAAASGVRSAAGTAADTAKSLASQASHKVSDMAGKVTDEVTGLATETANSVKQTAVATADSLRGTVGELRDRAGEQVDQTRRMLHDGQDAAHHLGEDATRLAADTRQAVSKLLEEQPILVAAIGTALGAIFGAALPVSQAERKVLGKVGAEAIDKGRDVIETAKETVSEQIADANLGEKVGDVAGKLVDSMVPTTPSRSA